MQQQQLSLFLCHQPIDEAVRAKNEEEAFRRREPKLETRSHVYLIRFGIFKFKMKSLLFALFVSISAPDLSGT